MPNDHTSGDIDTIINGVLDVHFKRIKRILREGLPDYLKEKLPDHMPHNTVDLVVKALPDKNVSTTLNEPHNLQLICLAQVVGSLNRSKT